MHHLADLNGCGIEYGFLVWSPMFPCVLSELFGSIDCGLCGQWNSQLPLTQIVAALKGHKHWDNC